MIDIITSYLFDGLHYVDDFVCIFSLKAQQKPPFSAEVGNPRPAKDFCPVRQL